jgi:hypothetical protein
MGSNLDIDAVHQHFILDKTEININAPEKWLMFHMYLDIISQDKDWNLTQKYQFGIMDFYFVQVDSSGNESTFFEVGFQIELNQLESFVNQSLNYFSGNADLKFNYKVNGGVLQKGKSSYPIYDTNQNSLNTLFNNPLKFYSNYQTETFNYISLLSPQPFFFSVNK